MRTSAPTGMGQSVECGHGTCGYGVRNANPCPASNPLESQSVPHSAKFHGIPWNNPCNCEKHGRFQVHIHIYTANGMKKTLLVRQDVCIRAYNDILGNMCIQHAHEGVLAIGSMPAE